MRKNNLRCNFRLWECSKASEKASKVLRESRGKGSTPLGQASSDLGPSLACTVSERRSMREEAWKHKNK